MKIKQVSKLSSKIVLLIMLPSLVAPLVISIIFLFGSFKSSISNTVYSDLDSLVHVNSEFINNLIDAGMDESALVKQLEPLYNSNIIIGKTGFLFCIDTKGNLVVHKKAQGENWKDVSFIKYIIEHKNGFYRYISPKTNTYKLASFSEIPNTGLIIVASAFEEDFLAAPIAEIIKTSIFIFSVSLLIGIIYSMILINRIISVPLRKIVKSSLELTEKADLTIKFFDKRKTRDEINILYLELNSFIEKLHQIISNVKNSAKDMLFKKNRMVDNTVAMAESVKSIVQQLDEESKIVDEISTSVESCHSDSGVMNKRIDDLSRVITEQVTMVEESSASINEMLASVSNVNSIMADQSEAASDMVIHSKAGLKKVSESAGVASAISGSADEIKSTIKIITDIAAQTNLLAMNAAIEAAHAGESGKGFGVVASEIRKLAESANFNSKRISDSITSVMEKIELNSEMTHETVNIFKTIDSRLSIITDRIREAADSLREMKIGGEQIAFAVDRLQEISIEVNSAGKDILSSSGQSAVLINNLDVITSKLRDSMKKIEEQSDIISGNINSLVSEVDSVSIAADGIDKEVGVFRI